MNTFKTITLALLLIILSVAGLRAEEISLEQFADKFFNEFFIALQLKELDKIDVDKVELLFFDNPNTAKQFQQTLARAGEDELANVVEYFRLSLSNSNNNPMLDRLQEEGEKAYEYSDHITALTKWQIGLKRAQKLDAKSYISQFLGSIGLVYNKLGQYQTALNSFQQALTIQRKIRDKHEEGNTLSNIGVVYGKLGQYQLALNYFQQALTIHREIKNRRKEGGVLGNIGNVYNYLSQYQTALDHHLKALTISREFKDRHGEGNNFTNIGNVYSNLSQYQTALDYYQRALKIRYKIKDRYREAMNLSNIGNVYLNLEQYQIALDYLQQALTIRRKIQDTHGEGYDLTRIGNVHNNLSQYQTALNYLQQALKIQRKMQVRHGEGDVLSSIGVVYGNLGQYQTALSYYQQSLEIKRKIGDRRGEGDVLFNIGVVYGNLSQYQTALSYYQQALPIHHEIQNKHGEGKVLFNIGVVYQNLGQYQTALDYLQKALPIYREIKNRRGEGNALLNIGNVYNNLSQYQTALKYYQQVLTISRKIEDKYEGGALANIGTVYINLSQYQTALDYFQQALSIHRKVKDSRGEGVVLGNIGVTYDYLGQYQTALEYYQQALTISRETKNKRHESGDLNNIGGIYTNLGQYQTALYYYQQALTIQRKIQYKHGEGATLNNIGLVYDNLGQYQTALNYQHQNLKIIREIQDKRGEGISLGNIGVVHKNLGQYQNALDYFMEALSISREIQDKQGEGNNLSYIGNVSLDLGQYKIALVFLQQAMKIKHEVKDVHGEGNELTNIGLVYENFGKYQQAKEVFQDSASILETVGSSNLWVAQRALASAEAKLNQPESAIQHYEQALDNIERLRAGLIEKRHKFSFMRNKIGVYDELIALLQSLHPKHPKKGYDRKAIEIFERKQGRVFLEEMGQSGARRFVGIPKEITKKEQELVQQIARARKNRNEALEKGLDAEPHRQRLEKLEADQQAFEQNLKTDYPAYYALKYPKPVDLATLQNQVLQKGEMMLVYGVLTGDEDIESKTILWVIGKQQFQMLTLDISEEELQAKVDAFRQSPNTLIKAIKEQSMRYIPDIVEDNLPKLRQAGYELYQSLMPAKVKTLIKDARTLYIVPTGPLYDLPFGALDTHDPNQHDRPHYLIQDYPIVYLSSASLLKTLRDTERKQSDRYPFLAFADPEYPKTCEMSQTNVIQSARTEAYLKLAGSDNAACFAELPDTRKQATAITQLLKAPANSQPLQLRAKASKHNVFDFSDNKRSDNKRLDDYQYVLFAAHAVLPNEISYINQPAIVLSNPHTEGYLKMADVFALQMNADLVMLSACNTGRGEKIKGEGVRGLTRAFMYAGTPAVSVSLWSVESSSAKNLSVGLFDHLQQGQSLAQALRQSKLDLMANEDMEMYQHPYFWAPFVVFGDGASSQTRSSNMKAMTN